MKNQNKLLKQIEMLEKFLIKLDKIINEQFCSQTDLHGEEFHDLWTNGTNISTKLLQQKDAVINKLNELRNQLN